MAKRKSPNKPDDGFLNDLIGLLEKLEVDDLKLVKNKIDALIAEKAPPNTTTGVVFDELRNRLRHAVDADGKPRYTFNQMESFRAWKFQTIKKQIEFGAALHEAKRFFIEHGFEDNHKLINCILGLVMDSPHMTGTLSLTDIIKTLNDIEDVVHETLPGWFNSEATISLLREKFK